MKKSEIEILLAWFVNEEIRIDSELTELRQRVRFRRITIEDNVELMLTQQRYEDFIDFRNVVLRLLNLDFG